MQFAVMTWVSDNVKVGSLFGIVDKDKPGQLPTPSAAGHWADFKEIDESRAPWADDAKEAIAEHGYYLMGAGVTITEAFGDPA